MDITKKDGYMWISREEKASQKKPIADFLPGFPTVPRPSRLP